MKLKKFRTKTAASLAGLALLAVPLAACGGGSDDATPVAQINALSGGSTSVALDKGFTDALTKLGLTPTPAGSAKIDGGAVTFPISGGWAAYYKQGTVTPYVVGQIQHIGSGLTLTAGGTAVTIGNFNVDPGISEVYGDVTSGGKVVAYSAPIFDLDGNTLQAPMTQGNQLVLTGTKVFVSGTAAALLNKTFGTDAVTDQLEVGVATIKLDLP